LNKIIVVKIGGATLGGHETLLEDVVNLQKQGQSLVLVHGGGNLITEWLEKRRIPSKFIQGERVTDGETLEVVISVLAGLVNKEIVAAINGLGGQAIGISGVDGALIQGKIKDKELGYVGAVVRVNITPLKMLLESGYIPVVNPVSFHLSDEPEETGRILNINADVVAGEIAAAVGAEKLIFLTDVAGVCDDSGKLLPQLSSGEVETLITSGVISGGMIPKIRACLRALATTTTTRIVDGREECALLKEIEEGSGGTTIRGDKK